MILPIRKIIFSLSINFCFLIILILGIQNSNIKNRVKFLGNESANLPLSFIIGVSFIAGSITGIFLPSNLISKNEE
tara:strand:- start:240 stop:467 length:228 start_codon:yes stop_codon:yes gene_type:complete